MPSPELRANRRRLDLGWLGRFCWTDDKRRCNTPFAKSQPWSKCFKH